MKTSLKSKRLHIGMTGGMGSGKSSAAHYFTQFGASIIDTDALAHQLTQAGGEAMAEIEAQFGAHFLEASGALNRAAMRELVFKTPDARATLEAILHPLILQKSLDAAENAQGEYVIFDVPLLFETDLFLPHCARSLLIDCPESLQIERVMARNGHDLNTVRTMLAAQMSREEKRTRADDVILNDSTLIALKSQVYEKHCYYCQLAITI